MSDLENLLARAAETKVRLEEKLEQSRAGGVTSLEDVASIEALIRQEAKTFADTYLHNPGKEEYELITTALTVGWNLGVRHATAYVKEKGLVLPG